MLQNPIQNSNKLKSLKSEKWGPGNGGGGIGFACDGRIFLADTFDLVSSGKLRVDEGLLSNGGFAVSNSMGELVESALHALQIFSNEEAQDMRFALQELHFDSNCLPENTGDDNIQTLPKGCQQKVQIASQRDGRVCLDGNLLLRMSSLEKALLIIHEAYVYAYKKPGEFTTRMRKKVEGIADRDSFKAAGEPMILPLPGGR